MGEYKELTTGNTDDELDFEIVIEGDQALEEEDVNGGNADDTTTDEGKDKQPKAPIDPKTTETDRKVSRSEKRIKELHTRAKSAEAEAAELREQLENERKAKVENTHKSAKETKEVMEAQIESLNSRLIKAIEEGDTATTVAIQNDLLKTSNKLYDLTKEVENYKPYQPKKTEQVQQPKVSEKAQDWLAKYSFVKEDEVIFGAAVMIDNKLASEGWDRNTEEFYEEVTARLAKRFPKEFGTTDENSVELETDTTKPSGEKTKNKSQRHVEQTVSGASRTPSTTSDGKPANNKKNTITLTTEDIRLAKKWNMTPEQFAKRKLALQNKERGNYIEINA